MFERMVVDDRFESMQAEKKTYDFIVKTTVTLLCVGMEVSVKLMDMLTF